MKRYKSVDDDIDGAEQWQAELKQLRKILNSTKLEEEVKWDAPCYTFNGKNIVGRGAFKSYVGRWLFHSALLEDEQEVLMNAQDGKTKALRQWRFGSKKDITSTQIKAYVKEAILLSDQGRTSSRIAQNQLQSRPTSRRPSRRTRRQARASNR